MIVELYCVCLYHNVFVLPEQGEDSMVLCEVFFLLR